MIFNANTWCAPHSHICKNNVSYWQCPFRINIYRFWWLPLRVSIIFHMIWGALVGYPRSQHRALPKFAGQKRVSSWFLPYNHNSKKLFAKNNRAPGEDRTLGPHITQSIIKVPRRQIYKSGTLPLRYRSEIRPNWLLKKCIYYLTASHA